METFGSYLKAQREKKGIRLEEIASITKIHIHNLERLEHSQWDKLPPEPFIRGFLSAYAKYVGLDITEVIDKYHQEVSPQIVAEENQAAAAGAVNSMQEAPTSPGTPRPSPTEVIQKSEAPVVKRFLVAASVVAVIGLLFGIGYVGKRSTAPEVAQTETAPAPETAAATAAQPVMDAAKVAEADAAKAVPEENRMPTSAEPGAAAVPAASAAAATGAAGGTPPVVEAAAPAPTAAPVTAANKPVDPVATLTPTVDPEFPHELVVEGKVRTWMKIVVDDAAPAESFLPAGEKAVYKAKEKIKLVLGDSTGAKVVHNGEEATGKKFSGTIRFYTFPAGARFPQDQPAKRATAAKPEEPPPAAEAAPETAPPPSADSPSDSD